MAGGQKVEGDESEDKAPEMQQPNLVKKESPEPGPTPGSSGPAPIPVSPGPDPTSWRKFFVILTGKTNDAHQSVVKNFESLGQTEVRSPDDADYYLVFCPISSRVGTDVSEAMEHLPDDKAAVLVVMHHTFNPDQVIPPSRRLVTDQRVHLTLDCLFHQNKLLDCEFNKKMKASIKAFFKISKKKKSSKGIFTDGLKAMITKKPGNDSREGTSSKRAASNKETSPQAGPSGSEVIPQQKEQKEDTESLKSQNTEVQAGQAQETDLEKQNAKFQKEEAEQTQKDALSVKSPSSDVSVRTNSKGEPGSMDRENNAGKTSSKSIFTNCLKAIKTKIFPKDKKEGHQRAASTTETSPQAGPSGSEVIPQQKEQKEDTESLKSQNTEVQAGQAQEKDLEKQNAKFQKEAEQTQKDALFVKSPSSDVSVCTNSKGEPGSMDRENNADMTSGPKSTTSRKDEEKPQNKEDGNKQSKPTEQKKQPETPVQSQSSESQHTKGGEENKTSMKTEADKASTSPEISARL
ncbi:eukaryotic translation initiation factor 5B-like isoform X3 [Salarias fasciatus]|uniref:eukaryotic translation initiation factor 5B-like isoform X3 n=1 Tax=Salarias fasciatus TaxID=181472 RepID=UPI001176D4EC|nr:eukaryotic translation initiation factor 5B-like isoform X3 [Salarias fasciatus]